MAGAEDIACYLQGFAQAAPSAWSPLMPPGEESDFLLIFLILSVPM